MCQANTAELLKVLDLDFDSFNAIMCQFKRFGFIDDLNLTRNHLYFILLVDAIDYKNRGGFTFQEEVLETNINKLLLEIKVIEKQLEPKHLETANKISTIASAIFGGISLFKK